MASKSVSSKKRKISIKINKSSNPKAIHRKSGATKPRRKLKVKVPAAKVKSASRKPSSSRVTKTKRPSPKAKRPSSVKKVRTGTKSRSGKSGKLTRTVAMVRRAASTPAPSRNKGPSATAKSFKKKQAAAPVAKMPSSSEAVASEPKLTASDFEYFRKLLVDKRRELLGDMGSMENNAFNSDGHSASPIHMADVGSDNFEQEFTLGLLESERQTLREIHEAIERVDNGTFGICTATGKPIGRARLEAKPWAKYCIEYARQLERGQHPSLAETTTSRDDSDEDDD